MRLRTNGEPSDVLSIPPLTEQEKEEWGVDSTIRVDKQCGPKRAGEGMWWEM